MRTTGDERWSVLLVGIASVMIGVIAKSPLLSFAVWIGVAGMMIGIRSWIKLVIEELNK